MSGLQPVGQADVGAGIYRGREAPDNAAYDLLNCLIDDEGQPYRRGGSAYKSTANAGSTLVGVFDAVFGPGLRTLMWGAGDLYVLDASDAPLTLSTLDAETPIPFARFAMVGPYAVAPAITERAALFYAGSRKADYSTGTVTYTAGSRTVTGVGTAWLANVDPGMIAILDGEYPVVESVESNTSLTIRSPVATSAAAFPAVFTAIADFSFYPPLDDLAQLSCVASAGRRLLVCSRNIVGFSEPDNPFDYIASGATTGSYHELPGSAFIVGAEGLGGSALIFTTDGVYVIDGLYFDAVDDVGNDQHAVNRVNDLVLWANAGIARWRDVVVAPCVDDVWLMPAGGEPVPVGAGIRPLYLSYVKAGYQPGLAAVHRGHYFLPVLNGTTLVDMLVCRLDRGFAWTRWSGHGAGVAYTQRIGSTTRSPKLFGVAGQRVTDLTDAWSPSASNASEADATTHALRIDTRDLPTPGGKVGSTTQQVRVRYEATAASTPTFTVSYARGPEGASFTSLGAALDGGAASDGLDESVWAVRKKAPAIRFRLESSSALSTFTCRSIEARYTESGAQ